jgi:nicotinamidase-related amidase
LDALLVVDMQEALLLGEPKHDLDAVAERINRLATRARQQGGCVLFIQHEGPAGDDFAPSTPGWEILGSIETESCDHTVSKKLNDAFFETSLHSDLKRLGTERVLVAGWATDFCVDATVRSAAALGFRVVVVSDAHTLCDRPHLKAEKVIEHHHWVWTNLIAPHPVQLAREAEIWCCE